LRSCGRIATQTDTIVAELLAPGALVSAIARKHNVAVSLLFRWRKQFTVQLRPRSSETELRSGRAASASAQGESGIATALRHDRDRACVGPAHQSGSNG